MATQETKESGQVINRLRAAVRDARYALPQKIERLSSGPDAVVTIRRCRRLDSHGIATTVGYFQSSLAEPEEIFAAHLALLRDGTFPTEGTYLSVKAPPLQFSAHLMRSLAQAAADAGMSLLFDAHAPKDADPTLEAAKALLGEFPLTGVALPARWRRSELDALEFRETTGRIRIVKGEWPDPGFAGHIDDAFLALVGRLAGRQAPVAVATHDPVLAERALALLLDAKTPCELEQLRGLPGRRTAAVAKRLAVPVRVYLPFGPGWWPYAFDKALGRPYLLSWMIRDRLGLQSSKPIELSPA